jgi:hypothetical protein
LAPLDVIGIGPRIDGAITVRLPKVKRWIGEHRVHEVGLESEEVIEAITFEENPAWGDIARL